MARPKFVQIPSQPLSRFEPLLGDRFPELAASAEAARERYRGRAIWHVSSTLRGGGVAEMLRSLLPYARGAGIDTRWVVLRESPEFFTLTKRLHNHLHEDPGDGGPLGEAERRLYERALATSGRHLGGLLRRGDVVFLHDPQTAGLAELASSAGATVVWRCHIGVDQPGPLALAAQDFLRPYVRDADAWVFSRREYIWSGLDHGRGWAMAPAIDPFSPKNQELEEAAVTAILGAVGLLPRPLAAPPAFLRADGTPGRVERNGELLQEELLPAAGPVVAQISRWDRLKDHRGLLACFERHLAGEGPHLLLAGPASSAIADDPEGAAVWAELRDAWRALPAELRARVHLANLPLDDLEENGAVVNAIQRRADVVVQKSLAEGFGLTVAEAMWKARAVIGARVGGIQDQIVDGASGVLVDPRDGSGLAAAIAGLCSDPERAARLGAAARERIRERFLGPVRLVEYARRLAALEDDREG